MRYIKSLLFDTIVSISPVRFLLAAIYIMGWNIAIHYDKDKRVNGIVAGNEVYVNKFISENKESGENGWAIH